MASGFSLSQTSLVIDWPNVSTYSSDTAYWLDDVYAYGLTTESKYEVSLNLSCSTSGLHTVSYAFSPAKGNAVPNWASVDETKSALVFNTPSLTQPASYTFTLAETSTEIAVVNYRTVYVRVTGLVTNCKAGMSNESNKGSECNNGYQLYYNLNFGVSTSNSDTVAASTIALQIGIGLSMLISSFSSLFSLSSPQGIWLIVHQIQTLMLLLLTGAYFPKEITDILSGVSFASFSFGFMPILKIPGFSTVKNWFDFDLNDEYLEILGLTSGSSFVNSLSLLTTLAFIAGAHVLFACVYKRLLSATKTKPKGGRIVTAIVMLFNLTIYIRVLMQANQFMLVSSLHEVKLGVTQPLSRLASLAVAVWLLAVCVKLVFAVSVKSGRRLSALQYSKSKQTHEFVFDELFSGKKSSRLSRLDTLLQLYQRTLLVVFLMIFDGLSIYIQLGVFLLLQITYTAYTIGVRPFSKIKENLIQIVNELSIVLMLMVVLRGNKEPDWSQMFINGAISFILVSSFITGLTNGGTLYIVGYF